MNLNKNVENASQYAVFFDIDGTILPEDDRIIPESAKQAIRLAQENGHLTFINTGRTFKAVDQFIRDLNFDGYVCGCGTNIYFHGEEIFKQDLGKELSAQIVKDLIECHLDGVLEGASNVYFRRDPFHPAILKLLKSRRERGLELEPKYWDDEEICYDKMAIWFTKDSDIETFRKKYEGMFEFIHREVDFYELVPAGFSKATGMKYIEEHMKIAHEHTIAIGDSNNDLSMLEYAGISIGMGNSTQTVLDMVTYVTDDIHDDGIYKAMQKYNLI